MIETLFQRSFVIARLRHAPLGPHLEELATTLVKQGYARQTIRNYLWAIAKFGDWLSEQGLALSDLDEAVIQHYLSGFPRRPSGGLTPASGGLTPLLRLLRQKGIARGLTTPRANPSVDQWSAAFEDYLRKTQGASSVTIERYRPFVRRFLSFYWNYGESGWQGLGGTHIAQFVYREVQGRTGLGRKAPGTAVRAFLRFLVWSGQIRPGLEAAVPVMRQPSHAGLPRQIPVEQVASVLKSCRNQTPQGLRNYAILLLLARLGLRAHEVVTLRLEDIDWREGTLSLGPGKPHRERRLPLPFEVGEAIIAYLRRGRPESTHREIFLRVHAPYVPLSGSNAITRLVKRALQRAGFAAGRGIAAHSFRYTAASTMVCRGASFKDVADVLGHRRLHTTCIYAKLDLATLSRIALPWPGGAQ